MQVLRVRIYIYIYIYIYICTGLFEMIVGVFLQLVIHNTLERGVYVFFV